MITDCPTVAAAVQALYGASVTITGRQGAAGGSINRAAVLSLSNGETVFLKENSARYEGMFLAEAAGLNALDRADGPRVPVPLATHSDRERQFILLSHIREGRPNERHWTSLGQALARLHAMRLSDRFGFESDNFIGSTPQPNPLCDGWVAFFGAHRLGFQIRLAATQGLASKRLIRDVEALISKLDQYIDEPPHPSLLHGDLWSGNVMADERGDPVIFDPAVYFGHYEAELAMTELFGRFPQPFYDAYREILPIDGGYEESRRTIYALYHILNHLNLFGASYAGQAAAMVGRFVG